MEKVHEVNKFNPLNTELNPMFHLLAILGAHHIHLVTGLQIDLSEAV
jgi:hypothetical protein